eukprot:4947414-Prymnesium_polylepis.1
MPRPACGRRGEQRLSGSAARARAGGWWRPLRRARLAHGDHRSVGRRAAVVCGRHGLRVVIVSLQPVPAVGLARVEPPCVDGGVSAARDHRALARLHARHDEIVLVDLLAG